MYLFHVNDSVTRSCGLRTAELVDTTRLAVVGILGTSVALTSVFENSVLFFVFSTSKKLRRQNYANPVLLALFDIVVSLSYLALMSGNVLALHSHNAEVIELWTRSARLLYCVQHVALTISNFLLVIASLERFFANSKGGTQKWLLVAMVRKKVFVIIGIVVMALLFKAPLALETSVLVLPHCPPLERVIPIWVSKTGVGSSIRFWLRKTFTVIVPFFILAFCNWRIVCQLRDRRRQTKSLSSIRREAKNPLTTGSLKKHYNEKKGVRVATRTLVMVVGCYLISNTTSTIINIWEYFDENSLRHSHFYAYLLASDFSSLLTIVGCALRLPIYVLSDRRIRKAVVRAFVRCRYGGRTKELAQGHLEKWSIVIVSNSLRSNLTAQNLPFSQEYQPWKVQRTKDELAFLLHKRRQMLVDMTIMLTASTKKAVEEEESTMLTDIQEEDEKNIRSWMTHV